MNIEYLMETLAELFGDENISVTDAQLERLSYNLQMALSVATDYSSEGANTTAIGDKRILALQLELKREQEKVTCPACKGKGAIGENLICGSCIMTCSVCNGSGKV